MNAANKKLWLLLPITMFGAVFSIYPCVRMVRAFHVQSVEREMETAFKDSDVQPETPAPPADEKGVPAGSRELLEKRELGTFAFAGQDHPNVLALF